jgi:GAF domain-containing protein
MTTVGDRLHLLYEINRRLTTLSDLDALVHYATERTRELFNAEGCALLLLDRETHELYFPVVSASAAHRTAQQRLAAVRFPADRGIAGWVLSHNQAVRIDDVSKDARFYQGVDQTTQMTTRALLCAPLHSQSGNIGVIEVMNPAPGELVDDDLEFLGALADDIAVAYEKAELYQRLRGEVIGLRQVCNMAGLGLLLIGILFILGAAVGHLAMALPLSELPTRPGTLSGLVSVLAGGLLVGVARGWFVTRTHVASAQS